MMESKEMAMKIAKLLDERKAIDVDNIEELLEPEGVFPKSAEGTRSSGWILMDYGDVVVNVMTVEMREKYNIEKVWGDCKSLTIG